MIITHPVHGTIELNELLTSLVNTPEINRLKRIQQLSMVQMVFPGATHSRFLHALGVCYIAGRIADYLGISKKEKDTIQAAALLHDVGHGPFSHTLDALRPASKDHEAIAKEMILGRFNMSIPGSGKIPKILDKHEIDKAAVAKLIMGEYKKKPYLQQIINGPVDADKMDYLMEDAHFTGTKIGTIDIDRIISVMVLEDNNLKFLEKGIPTIKALRTARSNMHSQVYIHHTSRIADRMMLKSVELSGIRDFYEDDDNTLLSRLMSSENSKVRDLIGRILYNYNPLNPKNNYAKRNLYKVAYQIDTYSFNKKKKSLSERLKKIGRRKIETILLKITNLEEGDLIVDFPDIFPIMDNTDLKNIHFKKEKQNKTNYSCFSVYCSKENKEKVSKASGELIKMASKPHLGLSWIKKL